MAQVKSIGTIRRMFAGWHIEVVAGESVTREMAGGRLRVFVNESQPKVRLQVRDPRQVVLRWVRR